jgi:peptide/nickel transport system substrate-binding protein
MTRDTEADINRRTIIKAGAGLGAAGLTSLAGCTNDGGETATSTESDGGSGTLSRGGVFNVGAQQDIQTMSPFGGFLADYLLGEAMYDRLTRVGKNFELEPNLAKSWENDAGYSTWTFSLTSDATFSNLDGEAVTAEDVKATYEYLTSDQFAGSASSISNVQAVEAIDEQTIEINLASSDIEFPKRLAENGGAFFIAPKSVLEDDPSKLEDTDYGSGPLTLVEWDQKNYIRFQASESYHLAGADGKPLPYFDELKWDILSDEIQRVNALADGSIDAVSRISPKVTSRLGTDTTVVKKPSGLQFPIILDTTIDPLDNVKVRQAIKHGLDRTEILEATQGDGVLGHHSGITPVHGYYNSDLAVGDTFGTTAQPVKATELLNEAGYNDGLSINETFYYDDGYPQKETIAVLFQQQMKDIGIEIDITQITEEDWLSNYWSQDGTWYVTNYSTRVLGETVPQLAIRTEGIWNEPHWTSAEFDDAFEKALTATDPAVKRESLDRCQVLNHREGAWVGTYHPSVYGGHKNYVEGYELYPTETKDFLSQCSLSE